MTATARIATASTPVLVGTGDVLERRLHAVDERISTLERQLASWPDDPHTAVALMSARSEAADLRSLLAAATHEDPGDPAVVEIGDTVTIRHARGRARERFMIVGGREARFDDSWISVGSPLGSALLGRRQGDQIVVHTPGGVERYGVVAIERDAGSVNHG